MASNTENRGVNIYLNANAADDTLKQLRDSTRQLNNELDRLPKGSQEFADKSKILQEVKGRLKDVRDEANGLTESFFNLKGELAELGKMALAGLSFGAIIDIGKDIISQNAKLSDSYAGVMKTTGLTEVQVEGLNRSLKQINTRTAKEELLGLAEVAGKLGYSSAEDVEGFVRAADKIGVALGEDLGGTEQAVNQLGKLLDIFKVKEEFGIEVGLLKVGSAINDLGATGTANEKNLIDFSTRLAGIAPAAKISLPNVLAIAAVMDEMGQSVQTSATAVGQFIVGMGADVPKFAKIVKMGTQEFANLLRDDANEALRLVLDASKNTGGGIAQLAKNMKELDVTGSEGRAAIGALANNIDLLRQRQDESNQSFKDGISINGEFDTVNTNLAANLEKISNKISTMWESSDLRNWLTKLTATIIDNRLESEKLADAYLAQKDSMAQIESKGLPLLATYNELKSKTKLTKEEQIKLNTTIQQLTEYFPDAVTGWNMYGQALDINSGKIYEMVVAQKELLKVQNQEAIQKLRISFNGQKEYAKLMAQNKTDYQNSPNKGYGGLIGAFFNKDMELFGQKGKDAIEKGKSLLLQVKALGGEWSKEEKKFMDLAGFKFETDSGPKVNEPVKGNAIITTPDSKKKSGKSQAEKDAEASQKLYQKLVKEEQLFNAEKYRNQLADNEKEIAAEQAKYDALISAWEGFRDKEKDGSFEQLEAIGRIEFLKADKEKEVGDLRKKQEGEISEAIAKIRTDMSKKLLTELDKERTRINDHYNKLKKDAGTNLVQQAQIEEARQKDLADAGIREEERLKKETEELRLSTGEVILKNLDRRLAEIDIQYDQELVKLREKFTAELQETELFEQAMQALKLKYKQKKDQETAKDEEKKRVELKDLSLKAAEDLSNAVFQIGANNRQAELDLALSNIDKAREKELSNKNLTEAQKKSINDKYDRQVRAEKLKAWKSDKNASLLQAGINTALAITKALPNIPLSIAAGIAGAAQMAVIASTKPPQFFHGGFTPRKDAKGWVREPTMFTNSFGNVFSAGENRMPEYVVSSAQLQDPRVADFVNMLESNRTNQISSLSNSPVIVQNNTDMGSLEAKMEMLIQAYASTQDKKVIIVYQDLEDMQTKKVDIINSVNS
ncbi:phage tail tape measure protein [Sphingobacterium anhuiense]|uniref:phage tail tape measure protein n=1 Tax=Sphingobacterium anhuiense TaxID=493780 RepID=UPI003C2F0F55